MRLRWMLLLPAMAAVGSDQRPLGEIDFFGYKGLDVEAVRAALPFHEGEMFPPAKAKSSDGLKRQVKERVKEAIGREATSVSFVCCDAKQQWMVYIGLPGESYREVAFHPVPGGNARLPKEAVALNKRADEAKVAAVMKGHAAEDQSEGYALSSDAKAKSAELAVRDYALQNEAVILQVLALCSDAGQRATAAEMLGYGRQSGEQVDALVRASLDADEGVRNNAVRALWLLAGGKPELARRVPAEPFIGLIHSGSWSDHNKASLVLAALTKSRDGTVLEQFRSEALDPLQEMARWSSLGHAGAALSILGRMAGIDENALDAMIESGEVSPILEKFK